MTPPAKCVCGTLMMRIRGQLPAGRYGQKTSVGYRCPRCDRRGATVYNPNGSISRRVGPAFQDTTLEPVPATVDTTDTEAQG